MYDSKGYRKDSMDRFGDDLTELILQYLTFEDKVRLECVSKQWRRLVFNKQFVIEFNIFSSKNNLRRLVRYVHYLGIQFIIDNYEKMFKKQELESLLIKCPNITKVIIRLENITNNELSLFGQYCPRLKSLHFAINSEEDLQFGRQYGHKLEELYLFGSYEQRQFLELCPNVKNVWISEFFLLVTSDKELLPKLEYFVPNISIAFRTDELKILSDKYSQTMKSLNLYRCESTSNEMKIYFDSISRFENLQSLKLRIDSMEITQPLDDCLSLIGQKCNKLLKLDLEVDDYVPISDQFFDTFSEFKAIKSLRIYFTENFTEVKGSIESLKHCKQLKHLYFDRLQLTEDFFININIFLPKLQFIRFSTRIEFCDSFIDSFNSMKDLQKIDLHFYHLSSPIKSYTKYWYFGKCLTEVMLSPNGMNVKQINDNCGLITI